MENINTKTVREIALETPSTVRVFEEFKIDYCCGGRKSLDVACREAGVDTQVVTEKVNAVIAGKPDDDGERPEGKQPTELVDYILAKHHIFTAQELERLEPLMAKVATRHGEHHPELLDLKDVLGSLTESLKLHMMKEENVLFPYIQSLDNSARAGGAPPASHFGTVLNPIKMMEADHDTDGERLRYMREITKDYVLPEGACPSYTALFAGLEDLEKDLHRHIHLENNVLFPAAAELEGS
jgi:regulator of cell morphogenesis and NO signaling